MVKALLLDVPELNLNNLNVNKEINLDTNKDSSILENIGIPDKLLEYLSDSKNAEDILSGELVYEASTGEIHRVSHLQYNPVKHLPYWEQEDSKPDGIKATTVSEDCIAHFNSDFDSDFDSDFLQNNIPDFLENDDELDIRYPQTVLKEKLSNHKYKKYFKQLKVKNRKEKREFINVFLRHQLTKREEFLKYNLIKKSHFGLIKLTNRYVTVTDHPQWDLMHDNSCSNYAKHNVFNIHITIRYNYVGGLSKINLVHDCNIPTYICIGVYDAINDCNYLSNIDCKFLYCVCVEGYQPQWYTDKQYMDFQHILEDYKDYWNKVTIDVETFRSKKIKEDDKREIFSNALISYKDSNDVMVNGVRDDINIISKESKDGIEIVTLGLWDTFKAMIKSESSSSSSDSSTDSVIRKEIKYTKLKDDGDGDVVLETRISPNNTMEIISNIYINHKRFGYKLAKTEEDKECIVILSIPNDAKVAHGDNEDTKLRCDKARIVGIHQLVYDEDGTYLKKQSLNKAYSCVYKTNYIYTLNKMQEIPDFNPSLSEICVPGIHFYLLLEEPLRYRDSSYRSAVGIVNTKQIYKIYNEMLLEGEDNLAEKGNSTNSNQKEDKKNV